MHTPSLTHERLAELRDRVRLSKPLTIMEAADFSAALLELQTFRATVKAQEEKIAHLKRQLESQ